MGRSPAISPPRRKVCSTKTNARASTAFKRKLIGAHRGVALDEIAPRLAPAGAFEDFGDRAGAGEPRRPGAAALDQREAIVRALGRIEAETGLRYRDWALVICVITDRETREGEIVGWQTGSFLAPKLPVDSPGGRWESAAITVDCAELIPSLPPAIA